MLSHSLSHLYNNHREVISGDPVISCGPLDKPLKEPVAVSSSERGLTGKEGTTWRKGRGEIRVSGNKHEQSLMTHV